MRYPKRIKKNGKPGIIHGIRLSRKPIFSPAKDTSIGIKVRSQLEQACINWLMARNIEFQYEPLILIENRQFRPDFYLPQYNLFLEICGYGHMPYYRIRVQQKKHLYEKFDMNSIFIECKTKCDMNKTLKHEFARRGLLEGNDKGE